MSEAGMWGYLQPRLKGRLHCERLTDRLIVGLPDVLWTHSSGATGLLELKATAAYPRDLSRTPVLTYGQHGLSREQAFWHNRWARAGGRSHILLQVGTDFLLWRSRGEPEWMRCILGVDAYAGADYHWRPMVRGDFVEDLIPALCA